MSNDDTVVKDRQRATEKSLEKTEIKTLFE